jgi:hypothetical protein
MAVKVDVSYHGPFFTRNPVGQFHRNQYRVLKDVGEIAKDMAQAQLFPGHGYVTGELHDSIRMRPERAYRGTTFVGRAVVNAGSRGHEPVRRYGKKIEARYHFMRRARTEAQSWVSGNVGRIAAELVRDLT